MLASLKWTNLKTKRKTERESGRERGRKLNGRFCMKTERETIRERKRERNRRRKKHTRTFVRWWLPINFNEDIKINCSRFPSWIPFIPTIFSCDAVGLCAFSLLFSHLYSSHFGQRLYFIMSSIHRFCIFHLLWLNSKYGEDFFFCICWQLAYKTQNTQRIFHCGSLPMCVFQSVDNDDDYFMLSLLQQF